MRCYRVEAVGDDKEILATRYGSTAANSKEWRDKLVEVLEIKKSGVTIEEIEVPLDKPGLLKFLNELQKEIGDVPGEDGADSPMPATLEPPAPAKKAAAKAPAKKAKK